MVEFDNGFRNAQRMYDAQEPPCYDPDCPKCKSDRVQWAYVTSFCPDTNEVREAPTVYKCMNCGHEWEDNGEGRGDR